MNPNQEKLLRYVREIHQRDKRGPEAFPLVPVKTTEEIFDEGLAPETRDASSELIGLKRAEAVNRGNDAAGLFTHPSRPSAAVRNSSAVLTAAAAEAFDRAINNRPLSDTDLIHLESIVLPALRPVFDIRDGSYDPLPDAWAPFNLRRDDVSQLISGIGRLQLTGHPSYTLVGTGFICGPNAIITNRHVAQIFVKAVQGGQKLCYLPGVSCGMDLFAEVGSTKTLSLNLTRPLLISSTWDVAVLHVEALPAGVAPLPLAGTAPESIVDGFAAVIGYPSYDPHESFIDQVNIFRSVFDRKRFQPGRLTGRTVVPSFGSNVNALAHDCTTLGGNSGSALISPDGTKVQVVGIHFSGITHVSNFAVPAWEIASDPAFSGVVLNFV